MVGWLGIMAFSRTATAGRSAGLKSGVGRSNTPDRVEDIGTEDRGYKQPTKQASPRLGDFHDRLTSKNEHLEAETCRRNEHLEAAGGADGRSPKGTAGHSLWASRRQLALDLLFEVVADYQRPNAVLAAGRTGGGRASGPQYRGLRIGRFSFTCWTTIRKLG
jgi:hypothetical protein